MHDPTTGKPFYVNHDLKITQWNRPREDKQTSSQISYSPADSTTSSHAMARILQASMQNNFSQPRSYIQEASFFQPTQSGTTGEIDLSDAMPSLDFAVKKVADKYRLECPHCDGKLTIGLFFNGLYPLRLSRDQSYQLYLRSVSVATTADYVVMCSVMLAAAIA